MCKAVLECARRQSVASPTSEQRIYMLPIQRPGFQLPEASLLKLSSHQFQTTLSVALRGMTAVPVPVAQLAQRVSQIVHRVPPKAPLESSLLSDRAVSVDANSRQARSPEGARARRSAEPVASSEASAVPSVESSGGGSAWMDGKRCGFASISCLLWRSGEGRPPIPAMAAGIGAESDDAR